jgi:hypothetical protein
MGRRPPSSKLNYDDAKAETTINKPETTIHEPETTFVEPAFSRKQEVTGMTTKQTGIKSFGIWYVEKTKDPGHRLQRRRRLP